jgi:uracil permease
MATTSAKSKAVAFKPVVQGYLPNDQPPFGKLLLLGLQHVLTMFPATILCALLMGFHVSTVLTVTGLGTIAALIGSKLSMGKFIPLYYGSSFSYIAAVNAITHAQFGVPVSDHLLSVVQAGFLATGALNVLVGLVIRLAGGKEALDKVLPPIITGSVACTIGIGLGGAALSEATGFNAQSAPGGIGSWFLVAMVTMVAAICYSVYLQNKGFIGLLPILLGAITGYIVAIPFGLVDFSQIGKSALITAPHFTFPTFTDPATLTVVISVGIMCIATIPESTAHLYQISLYVDHLAEEKGQPKYGLSRYVGLNLMLDGLDDMINGIFGSTAGTNYGENNSLMVITRNYSGPVLITAGCIAILLGFIGPLSDIVKSIPTAVVGGLMIYLFGVIGMQGIALMISEKVNLFDPKQLAVGAVILIVGIGGTMGFPSGFLPVPILQGVFPYGLPPIATGAIMGIVLNLIFVIFKPAVEREAIGESAAAD